MAERLAVAYAARLNIVNFIASSAGTRAVVGHAIQRDACVVLKKLGGETSNFVARQLTSRIASDADLVLTMTRGHRDAVLERSPQLLRTTFFLAEASQLAAESDGGGVANLAALRPRLVYDDLPDVPDPVGQSSEIFEAVGLQIADLLPPILELVGRSAITAKG